MESDTRTGAKEQCHSESYSLKLCNKNLVTLNQRCSGRKVNQDSEKVFTYFSSTPVFFPGEFHGQRSLAGYSPWNHKETQLSDLTLE